MKREFIKLIELDQNYLIIKKGEDNLKMQGEEIKKLKNLKKRYDDLLQTLYDGKLVDKEYTAKYESISKIIEELEENLKNQEFILMNECGSDLKKINNVQYKVDKLKIQIEEHLSSMDDYLEKEKDVSIKVKFIEEDLTKLKTEFYELKKEVLMIQSKDKKAIKKANTKIEKLLNEIPEDIIQKYKKVKNGHKIPIAFVNNDICSGCKVAIAYVTKTRLAKGEEIVRCDNCGRIIFPQE
ncbi:zinc ribbon domain-containing protein [Clostridium sp. DL1XJH146]